MASPKNLVFALNAERELVEGCRNGNLDAFQQLYQIHGGRMKSIAWNLLGNASDAEDAVQESFLKVYRNVGRFRSQSAFSTWIYRILLNVCYDLRRKRQRRQETPGPDFSERPVGSSDCADQPLRLTLENGLSRLNPRSRAVFLLFEVEGFKHSEIAQILEIPEGTSKSLLFEAKRELRKLLFNSRREGRL
ncbi:MAG TPA: RNA polymerase sigma factor [Acidobacteriota bacterium]